MCAIGIDGKLRAERRSHPVANLCAAKERAAANLGGPARARACSRRVEIVLEESVDAFGCNWPACQTVRYPRNPVGATVTFNEYAAAFEGSAQLEAIGNTRDVLPFMIGPPSDPVAPRVSTTRHGVTVKKFRPLM